MVIYLAEKVCYQLAGKDTPLVPIDPLVFMLAPHSMTNEEYDLWGLGIPFTNQVTDELDYDEFSRTRLMTSLTISIYVLTPLIFFNQLLFTFLYISNIQMNHLCYEGLVVGALINPPYLLQSVYAYGRGGFARECPIGCNTNVTSYPFPEGTRAVSSLSSLFSFLSTPTSQHLF